MKKHKNRKKDNLITKWLKRKIAMPIILLGAATSIVLITLIVTAISIQSNNILSKYNSLSGRREDSKEKFGHQFFKVIIDEKGNERLEIIIGDNKGNAGISGVGDSDSGTPDGSGNDNQSGSSQPEGEDDPNNTGGDNKGPEPPKDINATDEDVIKFFVDKGYSRNAAIGIAANLKAESGYDITAENGVGNKGIAQWDSGRWGCYRTYLSQIGQPDSLGAQLEFVYMEMNNISPATNQYSNKLSVSNFNNSCSGKYYATKIVAKYYERCGVKSNGYIVDWDGTNSSNDSKFINTCQGGQNRINYASAMN